MTEVLVALSMLLMWLSGYLVGRTLERGRQRRARRIDRRWDVDEWSRRWDDIG